MLIALHRTCESDAGTFGILSHKGVPFSLSLELPDRGNERFYSRIRFGIYQVVYVPPNAPNKKFTDCYRLLGVKDRDDIIIHKANLAGDKKKGYHSDLAGCIAPVSKIGELKGQPAGLASAAAMNRLHEITGRQGFELAIIDAVQQA